MLDSALEGFSATVFAYGQTGSGKTYTMAGVLNENDWDGQVRCASAKRLALALRFHSRHGIVCADRFRGLAPCHEK